MLRESHMVLFGDLITMSDRRDFGWPLLYSDVIALVEQQSESSSDQYRSVLTLSSHWIWSGLLLRARHELGKCDTSHTLLYLTQLHRSLEVSSTFAPILDVIPERRCSIRIFFGYLITVSKFHQCRHS